MKADLNLHLSCWYHPGSAWLAQGWCGLKVKGPIAYFADCTPVDKAFRCYSLGALSIVVPRSQNTDSPPPTSFPSNLHAIIRSFDHVFVIHQLLALCQISSSSATFHLEARVKMWCSVVNCLSQRLLICTELNEYGCESEKFFLCFLYSHLLLNMRFCIAP